MMSGFSIATQAQKKARLKDIDVFVSKYGRGDKGLTEAQKHARIERLLGSETERVCGFGTNKAKGIKMSVEGKINKPSEYPSDIRASAQDRKTTKIRDITVASDGSASISGFCMDGNENDLKINSRYSLCIFDDVTSARNEIMQKNKGVLKEVSDRTMIIHKDNLDLDILLEDDEIDTDKDKSVQC